MTVTTATIQGLKLDKQKQANSGTEKEYSEGFAKAAADKGIDPFKLLRVAEVLELQL